MYGVVIFSRQPCCRLELGKKQLDARYVSVMIDRTDQLFHIISNVNAHATNEAGQECQLSSKIERQWIIIGDSNKSHEEFVILRCGWQMGKQLTGMIASV